MPKRKRYEKKVTRLKIALLDAGVSVQSLAKAIGYAKETVRSAIAGDVDQIDPDMKMVIESYARDLGVAWNGDPWDRVPAPPVTHGGPRRREPTTTTPAALAGDATEEEPDVIPTKIYLDPDDWQHFGLKTDPWDELDLEDCWTSPRIQYNERTMMRAIQRRQLLAVVGEVGSGKSTQLRRLHARMAIEMPRVLWLSPGNLNRDEISEGAIATAILRDLGAGEFGSRAAEARGDLLRQELTRRTAEGDFPVLTIDEAHDMSIEGLIAIKRVWDSFTFNRALAVLLVGQLSLKQALQRDPRCRELAGRTQVLEIPPMSVDEVGSYIHHRVALAGGDPGKVFDRSAVEALVRRGAVAPLWIDALAAQAMRHARNTGHRTVTAAVVSRA